MKWRVYTLICVCVCDVLYTVFSVCVGCVYQEICHSFCLYCLPVRGMSYTLSYTARVSIDVLLYE
jgi:hypothetical protein